jgi:lipopolysaccharide export system permease protein
MRLGPIKTIDLYIIKKFLGTFFYAIALIVGISLIFDVSENIDEFIENEAPLKAIIFDYYLNFIPYFANLFSGLFTFIAVIFFTSKMAYNSEIIAILSSGVSFKRLLRPYMISAFVIASFSYVLGNFVIPPANQQMIEFKYNYLKRRKVNNNRDIHIQLEPGVFIYIERYDTYHDYGRKFSIEKFEEQKLVSKLTAEFIRWNKTKETWYITNYIIRDINGYEETITKGSRTDTTLALTPEDFNVKDEDMETMNLSQLIDHINLQKMRGVDSIAPYEVERHRRTAMPFAAFILSIIGVSLASRKIKGGLGLHLGLGLLLSFTYLMFQQITKTFAVSGNMSPLLSMWLPNFIFAAIAYVLYKWASR